MKFYFGRSGPYSIIYNSHRTPIIAIAPEGDPHARLTGLYRYENSYGIKPQIIGVDEV